MFSFPSIFSFSPTKIDKFSGPSSPSPSSSFSFSGSDDDSPWSGSPSLETNKSVENVNDKGQNSGWFEEELLVVTKSNKSKHHHSIDNEESLQSPQGLFASQMEGDRLLQFIQFQLFDYHSQHNEWENYEIDQEDENVELFNLHDDFDCRKHRINIISSDYYNAVDNSRSHRRIKLKNKRRDRNPLNHKDISKRLQILGGKEANSSKKFMVDIKANKLAIVQSKQDRLNAKEKKIERQKIIPYEPWARGENQIFSQNINHNHYSSEDNEEDNVNNHSNESSPQPSDHSNKNKKNKPKYNRNINFHLNGPIKIPKKPSKRKITYNNNNTSKSINSSNNCNDGPISTSSYPWSGPLSSLEIPSFFSSYESFRRHFYKHTRDYILSSLLPRLGTRVIGVRCCPIHPLVSNRFMKILNDEKVYPSIAYHGTHLNNMQSILDMGLCVPGKNGVRVHNGSAYGVGIYASRVAGYSLSYTHSVHSMFVCAVLEDKAKQVLNHGNILVAFNSDRIIPVFILDFANNDWNGELNDNPWNISNNSNHEVDPSYMIQNPLSLSVEDRYLMRLMDKRRHRMLRHEAALKRDIAFRLVDKIYVY